MRIVFFGTPEFAIPSLAALASSRHEIVGVVTRPDRPRGRGQRELHPSPVAETAAELGLSLLKPEKCGSSEFAERIRELRPDALAVAAYGGLLPDSILKTAQRGGWNVHPSLLPRWRGPAPIHRAIWAGDDKTGVTIMKLVSRIDAGPIARQETVPIESSTRRGDLEIALARLGASLLTDFLNELADRDPKLTDQDEAAATFAPVFEPREREINWTKPARELDRLIRALAPDPGAFFFLGDARIKVLRARVCGTDASFPAGTLVSRTSPEGWSIACGEGALEVLAVQPQGKEHMTMNDFAIGRRLAAKDTILSARTSQAA